MIRYNIQYGKEFFHPLPTEKEEVNLCCVECKKELKTKTYNHKITSSDGNVILMETFEIEECNHKINK